MALVLQSHLSYASTIGNTSGKVAKLRTSSDYHLSIQEHSELETIFQLSNGFQDCEWVGVNNKNVAFISILLSAEARGKNVRVWYYRDKFSPKWSNVCQAVTIEIIN